ncbi:MAG: hypothetical protein LH613_01220 [Chamaesiphon sp.]|nr:hypothetical protein [Chamaesiphon sp.]
MSGYQSRVFTFISNRTNQLKDTCTKGWRHLKVAVVWSGQILLYPLQLLAQATKIFPPQLPPPPQQRSLPSPPPVPDINIEQALKLIAVAGYSIVLAPPAPSTVDNWAIIDENLWNIEHSHPDDNWVDGGHQREIGGTSEQMTSRTPIIRGLSSLLIDRQLVLVTTENEILDILTISQQHEIRRRIGTDIARIWHQWQTDKLASHSQQLSPGQLLRFDRDLFLDSSSTNQQLIGGDEKDLPKIAQSDRDLPSPRLFDTVGKLRQRWHDWLKNLTAKSPETSDSAKPTLHQRVQSERQLPSNRYPFNIQPPKIERFLELPQLPPIKESNPSSIAAQPSPTQEHPIQATIAKLQPDWLKQWLNYYRDYLYIPSKNDTQLAKQPAEFKLTPLGEPQIISTGSSSGIIIDAPMETLLRLRSVQVRERVPKSIKLKQTLDRQNLIDIESNQLSQTIHPDLEYQPDWIEVDSELIGYNLSTIDKLLAWLDRLMLQIENWIVSIWDLITNHAARN